MLLILMTPAFLVRASGGETGNYTETCTYTWHLA